MCLRKGAVAVIRRDDLFLVIQRSQSVTAPGRYCFPGGGIEDGEQESQAIIRELHEELGLVDVEPVRSVWQSVTPRGVHLSWWLTNIAVDAMITPNPAEVAAVGWWTEQRMLSDEMLLVSNREFLESLARGEFEM
jgi:8-oxo-dGTP pyrophosphatase MutT (NUDIX family)